MYLTNMADNEAGAWHGLMWQAGREAVFRQRHHRRPRRRRRGVEEGRRLLGRHWSHDGVISTDPDFTNGWFTGLNTGKYATWLTGGVGPAFLAGGRQGDRRQVAGGTAAAVGAGQQVSGNWGGSTNAVIKGTQNPVAAAKFAEFLNTDPATTTMFNTLQSLFPSTRSLLAGPSFTGEKDPLLRRSAGQPALRRHQFHRQRRLAVAAVPRPGRHRLDVHGRQGPGGQGDVAASTTQWESQLASYAKNQGFDVRPAEPGLAVPRPRSGLPATTSRRERAGEDARRPLWLCVCRCRSWCASLLLFVLPLGYALTCSLFKNQLVGGTVFAGPRQLHPGFHRRAVLRRGGPGGAVLRDAGPGHAAAGAAGGAGHRQRAAAPGAGLFRLGVFIPYAIPGVVAALMWGYPVRPGLRARRPARPANSHVTAPGLPGRRADAPVHRNIVTWEFTGYNMIILYAALRTVPEELYEAAAVDGAGRGGSAWRIKIPALRPALLLCLLFSVIGSFQLFTEPNLLQRLAPTVIGPSYTPNLYAYSLAFISQEPDYAAAVVVPARPGDRDRRPTSVL